MPGGYEIAFQAWNGKLVTTGTARNKNWNLDLRAGTSPAITAVPGGFEVALQTNTGYLWTLGVAGHKNWGAGMMKGTSPAIAP